MKKLLSLLALGLFLSFGVAHAQDKKEPTAQQNKMAMCNKQAGDKKGDERKAYMSDCLKAKSSGPAAGSAACEKSAADKKLHGAAKSSHVKKCMADEKAAAAPAK